MEAKMNIFIFLRTLFYIFVFFPFVQIYNLGTDSQPYALIISLLMFPFIVKRNMNKSLVYLFVICIFSFGILFISRLNFNSMRSLSNYVSLFFISYLSYYFLKKSNGLSYNFFRCIVLIWFITGFIQTFIDPNFLAFLLPRGDSSVTLASGRGVIGLAPEPTFYGIMCVFFLLIGYLNFGYRKRINVYYILLLLQIFIFSRSSLVILLLFLALFLYLLVTICLKIKLFVKFLGIILLLITLGYIIISTYSVELSQIRIVRIVSTLMSSPEDVILLDASINTRIAHFVFPIYGFLNDLCLPHGYSEFNEFMKECFSNEQLNYWLSPYTMETNPTRIMSAWGCIFFELGFVGFLFLYVVLLNLYTIVNMPSRLVVVIIVIALLANAVSFAMAILPFFVGNIIYLHEFVVRK